MRLLKAQIKHSSPQHRVAIATRCSDWLLLASTGAAMLGGYIQILRRLLAAAKHAIVFDTTLAQKLPEVRSAQTERML